MAQHKLFKPDAPIQICSIDTIARRGHYPKADIVVIDEAHMATSKSFKKFLENYPDAQILGVTATPFVDESLRHIADTVIRPITVQQLVDQGYLVPLRYFAPRTPDLSSIRTLGGDFDKEQLAMLMNHGSLVGDIVSEWHKNAQGRPTIVFAVDIAHSQSIEEAFNHSGISCVHVEADTALDVRQAHINNLRTGKVRVITNVGVLCTGVDIPHLSCIILARPTKSYNLHIQQLGRGTRPFEGKTDCLILDHAGNVTRHGFINEERECDLDGSKDKKERPSPTTCLKCFAVFFASGPTCPICNQTLNSEQLRKARELKRVDGDLVEIRELSTLEKAAIKMRELKREAKLKGYKQRWAYYRLKDIYGEQIADTLMPLRVVPDWVYGR
jgi:superfamily II DNA or RNA helicase